MELGGAALPRGTSDRNPKFAASVYRFNLLPHFSEIKEFGRYSTPELEIDRNQTFPHHFTARASKKLVKTRHPFHPMRQYLGDWLSDE